ncbi:MAG: hypothetical protein H7Y59_06245 [Anaerolineales bacterium]|nr:hypothetical protein [Anaerolineales bacterium]
MKPIKDMTQLEIGAFICTHLKKRGIEVVLSGGALTSLYSNNKYVSKDLDLIDVYSVSRRKLISAMQEIGFAEKNRYFLHPESEYIVEFPPGPLTVGDEPIKKTYQVEFSTGSLAVISPTDCVKDRLAAYYHWGDEPSLSQAILVAKARNVDIEDIRKWSYKEGKTKEFQAIKNMLS